MSETPATEAAPMSELMEGVRRGDAKSPVLRTLYVIGAVLGTSGSTTLGAVIWATQHYDTITATLEQHGKDIHALAEAQGKIADAITALAAKESDIATAVGKLQGYNDGQRHGDAAPAGVPAGPAPG
jgi:hypothetical protein